MAEQSYILGQEQFGGPLASRFVDIDSIPWKPTQCEGVETKVLMEDKERGLLTVLTRWQPGATLPDHEHTDIEQTYILEGSIVDGEGEVTAGNYVWRPSGSRHAATAPNGCLSLAIFLKPNVFLSGDIEGSEFK
jgi:anti-sigma factor ChrR (cupin superfamily)